jgi:excisionase family DNA binding protein
MKGKNMEKLYTAEEVRVALKMKMPTIRSWIQQQRLPVVRAGRSVRIRESVLVKIIEEGLDAVTQKNDIT